MLVDLCCSRCGRCYVVTVHPSLALVVVPKSIYFRCVPCLEVPA